MNGHDIAGQIAALPAIERYQLVRHLLIQLDADAGMRHHFPPARTQGHHLICPHCHQPFTELIEIDFSITANTGHHTPDSTCSLTTADETRHTLAFECPHCTNPIDLPPPITWG